MKVVHEIVKDVSEKYPNDTELALQEALHRVQSLPNFEELLPALLHVAIRELLDNQRHAYNMRIKRANGLGAYNSKAKVVVGSSLRISKAYERWLDYRIGATTLGMLPGGRLMDLARDEANRAEGHNFNSALLNRLSKIVPKDKLVREVVSEERLKTLVMNVRKSMSVA